MRRELLAGAAALIWTAAGLAQTDEPEDRADDATRALEQLESARESALSIDVRAHLIDKRRIADKALDHAIGLREAGNPHIQTGEGLLLPGIKDDPLRSRVDLDKLRAERIAMIERSSTGAYAMDSIAAAEAVSEEATPVEEPVAAEPEPEVPIESVDIFGIIFIVASLTLLTCGVVYYVREKRSRGPKRRRW